MLCEFAHSKTSGIAWASTNSKIYEVICTMVIHCLGIAWIMRNNQGTLIFRMFVFSYIFSLLWEFTFPMFWKLYRFTGWLGKIWVFPSIFHELEKEISSKTHSLGMNHGIYTFPGIGDCKSFHKQNLEIICVFPWSVMWKFTRPMV